MRCEPGSTPKIVISRVFNRNASAFVEFPLSNKSEFRCHRQWRLEARLEGQPVRCNNDTKMAVQLDTQSAPPNPEFVERCQIEFEENPTSRIFAPLSEAYRKLGLVDQAIEVATRGTKIHPDLAAGHLSLGRALLQKGASEQALEAFKRTTELSPDNLLAFLLLGETHLQLKQVREALDAFKMVLFLNPRHERAQRLVQKWEFLASEDFDEEQFGWAPSEENATATETAQQFDFGRRDKEVIRVLSLADALAIRNDLEGAFALIGRAVRQLGPVQDLKDRLHFLGKRLGLERSDIEFLIAEARAREANLDALADSTKAAPPIETLQSSRAKEAPETSTWSRTTPDRHTNGHSRATQSPNQARIEKLNSLLVRLNQRVRG